ncbi:GNAT family N-acetyltransferase [Levilactobacillus yonginensis]|uniref:GNAT family N-acetyltransferase n=1 Tax=Levilactobacillus yonginensis TaxID=1054041 RepID=UPI000F77BBBD|nr:N-acetyltransferase [Levilactobacillus yonginensis]
MLTLKCYQNVPADNALLTTYQLSDPTYTATPEQALAIANTTPDRLPVMALNGNQLVGFLVLIKGADVQEVGADPATAVLVRSFSISETHRGQGFATQMLEQLPTLVRTQLPFAREIVLSVDHGNHPAQGLYHKVGFTDTGRREFGQYGEQFVLTLSLD